MIFLGLILLVIGFVIGLHVLVTIGAIVLVVGLCLLLAGYLGHGVGGRNYWY